jgi:hypothetical protein
MIIDDYEAWKKGVEMAKKYEKQLDQAKQKIYNAFIEYLRLIDSIATQDEEYELSIVLRVIQLRKVYYQFLDILRGEDFVTGFIEDALGLKTKKKEPKQQQTNKKQQGGYV